MPKSTKTNHGSKTNGSPLRDLAVSAGWGLAVIALLLVLLSLLLCSRDIPAGMTLPLVTVALAAGTLLAGYRCGRRLRQNGIMNGVLTGGMMFFVLLAASLLQPHGEVGLLALYKCLLMLAGGATGCVLAVNHRSKVKTVRTKRR